MLIRTLLTELALPPTLNLILLLAGLLLMALRHRALGAALAALAVATLFLCAVPWVKEQLYRPLEPYPPVSVPQLKALDPDHTAIVVLGGGLRDHSPEYELPSVSDNSMRRVYFVRHLLDQVTLPVLLSGGKPSGVDVSEANRMGLVLRQLGFEPRWLEEHSRTTWENAVNSAVLLKLSGIDTVVLVTDAWHMRRGVDCFLAQGLNVMAAPTGFRSTSYDGVRKWLPEGKSLAQSVAALHEWLGLLVYHVSYRDFSYGIGAVPAPDARGVIRGRSPPPAANHTAPAAATSPR